MSQQPQSSSMAQNCPSPSHFPRSYQSPLPVQSLQQNSFNSTLQQSILQITQAVSTMLDSVESIYAENKIFFGISKIYVHRVVMAIVAPIAIGCIKNISDVPYFGYKEQQPNEIIMDNSSLQQLKKLSTQSSSQISKDPLYAQNLYPKYKQVPFLKYRRNVQPKYRHQQKYITKYQYPNFQPFNPSNIAPYQESVDAFGESQAFRNFQNVRDKLEKRVTQWVMDQISKGIVINQNDIIRKAEQINDDPRFEVSKFWAKSYLKRNRHIKCLIKKQKNIKKIQIKTQNQSQDQPISISKPNPSEPSLSNPFAKYRQPNAASPSRQHEHELDPEPQPYQPQQQKVAIYDDGQEVIIIDKRITNQETDNFLDSPRWRRGCGNGNGFNFKNHSRFKESYFNQLNKIKKLSNIVVIKPSEKKKQPEQAQSQQQNQAHKQKQQYQINTDNKNIKSIKIDNQQQKNQKVKNKHNEKLKKKFIKKNN